MGGHVLDQVGRGIIQVPRERDDEERRQENEIIPRQDPPRPAEIEFFCVRGGEAVPLCLRVGQEEQEGAEQHRAVHPDIAGAHQVVQAVASDDRAQPALLPDVVPAHDEDHQHPQAVQLGDARFHSLHAGSSSVTRKGGAVASSASSVSPSGAGVAAASGVLSASGSGVAG